MHKSLRSISFLTVSNCSSFIFSFGPSLSHFSIFRKFCQMQTQTIKGQLRSNIESRSNLTLIQSLISRLRISKVMKNSLAIMTALAINAKNGVQLLKPTFYQLINNSTKNDISCKRKQDTFFIWKGFLLLSTSNKYNFQMGIILNWLSSDLTDWGHERSWEVKRLKSQENAHGGIE